MCRGTVSEMMPCFLMILNKLNADCRYQDQLMRFTTYDLLFPIRQWMLILDRPVPVIEKVFHPISRHAQIR